MTILNLLEANETAETPEQQTDQPVPVQPGSGNPQFPNAPSLP